MTDKLKYSELYSHQDGLYNNMIKLTNVNYKLFLSILLGGIMINYITGDHMFRTSSTYFGISVWTYAVHWFMHAYENTTLGKYMQYIIIRHIRNSSAPKYSKLP